MRWIEQVRDICHLGLQLLQHITQRFGSIDFVDVGSQAIIFGFQVRILDFGGILPNELCIVLLRMIVNLHPDGHETWICLERARECWRISDTLLVSTP